METHPHAELQTPTVPKPADPILVPEKETPLILDDEDEPALQQQPQELEPKPTTPSINDRLSVLQQTQQAILQQQTEPNNEDANNEDDEGDEFDEESEASSEEFEQVAAPSKQVENKETNAVVLFFTKFVNHVKDQFKLIVDTTFKIGCDHYVKIVCVGMCYMLLYIYFP